MTTPNGEAERTAAIVLHFASRLELVFAHFFFTVAFGKEKPPSKNSLPTPRELWTIPIIQAACNITTLIAIRDLDDVLTPRTPSSRPDDLKAEDLGYKARASFLSNDERRRINKMIVHSTAVAAFADPETSWREVEVRELMDKCVSQSTHLLKWVQENYSTKTHSKAWAAARFYELQIEQILQYREKQMSHSSS